jgi:ADP-heptose:LPS heptosyltransferase
VNIKRAVHLGVLFAETLAVEIRGRLGSLLANSPKRFDTDQIKSVCLFGYMGLGDALMFQRSFEALLKSFPNTHFDLICGKESQSKAILVHAAESAGRQFRRIYQQDYKQLTYSERRALIKHLRAQLYDAVIASYMTPIEYFATFIASIPIRIGHVMPGRRRIRIRPDSIFNRGVRVFQDEEHETSRHRRLVEELGVHVRDVLPRYKVSPKYMQMAEKIWAEHNLEGSRVIATHFGASPAQNWKKWDDSRWAETLMRLGEKWPDAKFLFLGVPSERAALLPIMEKVQNHVVDMTGNFEIELVAALLSKATLLLANDSGLGHLSMAVGTRTLRTFGMSDYWGYRALSDAHVDVFEGIACSPCLQLGFLKPYNYKNCGHINCLRLITVEGVTMRAKEMES